MIRTVAILLTVLILAPSVRADDEPLRVRASVSVNSMNVTQRATLTVHAEVAEGWMLVDLPFGRLGAGEEFGPLTVASSPRSTPARIVDGVTTRTWTIDLAPNLPASGKLPALRFKAVEIGGDKFTIERTAPIPVVVESVLEAGPPEGWDPTALRPALAPLPEPEESNAALLAPLLVVGGVVAVVVVLTIAGKRRSDPARDRRRLLEACREAARRLDADAPTREVAASAQAVIRRALGAVAGPRALAVTGEALPALLRRDVGLSPMDAALVCDVLARADEAMYRAEENAVDPAVLRDDAVRAVDSVRLASAGREMA